MDLQLPCPQQMHQTENLSFTSHFGDPVQAHRIRIFLQAGHQHGLLHL